jgi:polyisoprenoid-binding protein YceI
MPARLAVVLLLAVAVVAADRVTYLTDDPFDRDVLTITSEAPLQRIVTRTQEVKGTIDVDPTDLLAEPKVRFEAEASRLGTGIPLRDDHLRGPQWLNVNEHPTIVWELAEIKTPAEHLALRPGTTESLDVVGRLTLHGQTRELPATVRVTLRPASDETAALLPGDLLLIDGSFDLLLSDFGIVVPERARPMVANRQHVTLHLAASTQRLVPKPAE